MASAVEIATRALRRIEVTPSRGTPSNEDAQDAVAALNAMIASWSSYLTADLSSLPFDDRYEQSLVAMLAVRLAPDYGVAASPQLLEEARAGKAQIDGAFWGEVTATFDKGLLQIPPSRPASGTIETT